MPIGPPAQSDWLFVTPWAFGKLLRYVRDRYGDAIEIFITENGVSAPGEASEAAAAAAEDAFRTAYYVAYLDELCAAVAQGSALVLLSLSFLLCFLGDVCVCSPSPPPNKNRRARGGLLCLVVYG